MRVLVTGAAGLIGTHMVRRLSEKHEIYALDKFAAAEAYGEKVHRVTQDLTQPLNNPALPRNLDAVIHLAQSRYYRQFPDKVEDIFNVNVHGTLRLLEYARAAGARVFVFTSTGGLYSGANTRFLETDPLEAKSFYFASKYAAELLVTQYQEYLRTIILRFFFVYGPGQQGMLVPTLMQKVSSNERIAIDGNPGLRMNPIYVEDAVEAFDPALHLETSSVINIAGDEVISMADLVRLIGQALGKQPLVKHETCDKRDHLVGDNSRMKSMLGVYPRTNLIQGLRRTADAYLALPKTQNGPR